MTDEPLVITQGIDVTAPPAGAVTGTPFRQTSYAKRRIDVAFQLNPVDVNGTTVRPKFTASGTDQVTLRGYRVGAVIDSQLGIAMGACQMRMYGLPLSLMNDLATLGRLPMAGRNNTVTVSAGDDQAGMAVAFVGTVQTAFADFAGMPEVGFHLVAHSGGFSALNAAPPSSYRGSVSAAVIIQNIANQMGRAFENNGVAVQLSNPYLPGTLRDQLQAAVDAAGIEHEDDGRVIAIWPRGGSRRGLVPLISPDTGMIGYPSFTTGGVIVKTLFNPAIRVGSLIKVESQLKPACGIWRAANRIHEIESETPGGAWFTTFVGKDPGQTPDPAAG